jgi:hypothetical protein
MGVSMKKILVLFFVLTSVACKHEVEKKVDAEIAKQPEATSQEAADAGRTAILNSKNLNSIQKEKMLSLIETTRLKMKS